MLALYRAGRQARGAGGIPRSAADAHGRARDRARRAHCRSWSARSSRRTRRSRRSAAAAAGVCARTRSGRQAAAQFVGRDDELACSKPASRTRSPGGAGSSSSSAPQARARRGSRDELASAAKQRGLRILWGRGWAAAARPRYWPWTQALRDTRRSCERCDETRTRRFRFFEHVTETLRGVAAAAAAVARPRRPPGRGRGIAPAAGVRRVRARGDGRARARARTRGDATPGRALPPRDADSSLEPSRARARRRRGACPRRCAPPSCV